MPRLSRAYLALASGASRVASRAMTETDWTIYNFEEGEHYAIQTRPEYDQDEAIHTKVVRREEQ